jgi:hypothetical protein
MTSAAKSACLIYNGFWGCTTQRTCCRWPERADLSTTAVAEWQDCPSLRTRGWAVQLLLHASAKRQQLPSC